MANKRRALEEIEEIDGIVERLREFLRLNYMTGAEVARRVGVRDMSAVESKPTSQGRI